MQRKGLIGLVACVALLAALLTQVQWPHVWVSMVQVPIQVWLAAGLGACASFALRAARMQREWRHISTATWPACLHLFLWHNAALAWLPFRSGEGVYWWWLVKRWNLSHAQAITSLLWLRIQDGLVLLWITAVAMAPILVPGSWALQPWQMLLPMLLPLGLGLALWWILPYFWGGILMRLQVYAQASMLKRIISALQTNRGGRVGWCLCAANWWLKLAVLGLLLQALAPLGFMVALRGALGGEWAALLPLNGPAGLGPYEAGVWLGVHADELHWNMQQWRAFVLGDVIAAALVAHVFWLLIATLAAVIVHSVKLGNTTNYE